MSAPPRRSNNQQREEEIQDWLINRLATWLLLDPEEIDVEQPFASYGLTSITAVTMTGDLEDWLGVELSPILAYEYPTIAALARRLVVEAQS